MNYFLINNNYHYIDFSSHKPLFLKKDTALIEIPHMLDKQNHDDIAAAYRYEIAHHKGLLSQILNFIFTIKKINYEIHPSKEDVLFFYTEYEILNQYLARKFKQVGARVFLIEDAGFGTYVPFRFTASEPLTVNEWIKRSVYRCLPGLSKIRFLKLNGFVFFQMDDESIDAACLYNSVKLSRNIQTKLLTRNSQPIVNKILGRVIFLNEPIYEIYQNESEYIAGLIILIDGLCLGYKEVFFKFHPRESLEWREKIKIDVLLLRPNVRVLEEDSAIELLVEKYQPAAVASYFCSALLTLANRGIEPVYLFHLIPELFSQIVFKETGVILTQLGYKFVSDITEVCDNYKSGLVDIRVDQGSITLADIVASH
jgi:hypothetical protein